MKKLVIACLALAAILPSCKKGSDDPFISFRSRKARVAGNWTVSSADITKSNSTSKTSINGSEYTESDGSSSSTKGTVNGYTFTFEKGGTWNSDYDVTVSVSQFGLVYTTNTHIVSSGVWKFLPKGDGAKNKERINVSPTSVVTTTTTTNGFSGSGSPVVSNSTNTYAEYEKENIWDITQLKNKEIKATSVTTTTNGSSSPTVTTAVYVLNQ